MSIHFLFEWDPFSTEWSAKNMEKEKLGKTKVSFLFVKGHE